MEREYTIIEKVDNELFVYTEGESYFKKVERARKSPVISRDIFDNNCDTSHIHGDWHVVIPGIPLTRKEIEGIRKVRKSRAKKVGSKT